MTKAIATVLIALTFTFSGCSQKELLVTKKVYIKEPKYEFQKLDLDGVYIELKDKKTQRLCTEPLLQLNDIYKNVKKFYDNQIDDYNSSK